MKENRVYLQLLSLLYKTPPDLSVQVVDNTDLSRLQEIIDLVQQVYQKAGYIPEGESVEDEYTPHAVHFGVYLGNTLIAAARLIPRERIQPLKVEKAFKIKLPHLNNTNLSYVEVGHLAYNSFNNAVRHLQAIAVPIVLYRCLFRYALDVLKATHFVAGIDIKLFHRLKAYGIEFADLGPPEDYVGSLTVPCVLDLRDALEKLRKIGLKGRLLACYCAREQILIE